MEKAEESRKLYTRMRLWELPDQYVVEPLDVSTGSCLAVNRDGALSLVDEVPHCTTVRVPKIRTIFGVVGIVKLLAGSYLIVITQRERVGTYLGHPIYKILSLKVFPCDRMAKNARDDKKKMEAEFHGLLKVAEKTPGLYFSYHVNITLSTQRLNDLGNESSWLPLWRQVQGKTSRNWKTEEHLGSPSSERYALVHTSKAEPRFLWNNYMLELLIDNKKLDPYILPIIQGTYHSFQAAIGKDIIDVTLIGRRCTRRNGTRMWRRGADLDGYVANFVESEQIIQLKGYTGSFVQVRGSIPFLWEQIVDLSYKPKFEILKPKKAARVAERHFLDLNKKYGNVLAVDLVKTRGDEGRLSEKFATAMQRIICNEVRYLHFDFNKICGHVRFERLYILYDQIEDFLIKNRYYLLNDKGEKVETQIGIVRTNCIDCLDRTNVTQSMIGRKMLEYQLQRLGVFDADETISTHPNFDDCFKILWANHGDDISIQYSGTPALKGDFVRFGRRTMKGMLKDGWNALIRYYLNNFVDGTKQDSIDLVHGHYIVSLSRLDPKLKKGRLEDIAPFPVVLGVVLMGIFFSMLSIMRVRDDYWQLPLSIFWATLSIWIIRYVRANRRAFCNRPRLHKPPS